MDALYSLLEAVADGLKQLDIPYILTGGSLLGAIRQHSILFCDDDIDLAILESQDEEDSMYERAISQLPAILGDEYQYTIKPWEGGDKVRIKSCSNVFLDVFVIRKYDNIDQLVQVIGVKKNGEKQSDEYVRGIVTTINNALYSQEGEINNMNDNIMHNVTELELPCPIYHFNTRKAIELWPKEVYRESELYPIMKNLEMGPIVGLSGPHTPVWLLTRAFGNDCFDVYYQSMSHGNKPSGKHVYEKTNLRPLVASGGQWNQSVKTSLCDEHYIPMQPVSKAKRRHTSHNKSALFAYLEIQSEQEMKQLKKAGVLQVTENNQTTTKTLTSPQVEQVNEAKIRVERRTVYMDGVFDLFHVGHLHAIQQCAALGDRVIIGITGDEDASGYKRRPIMSQADRTAIVHALKVVDDVVCPCPLVVTEEFMKEWDIDLVVHGFADPKDMDRQKEFFQYAMDQGKFQEIEYYSQLSTTDIIRRIQADADDAKQGKNGVNPKWFGAALSAATNKSPSLPYNPFPLKLRTVIEPKLRKATKKRRDTLHAIKEATGESIYHETLDKFSNGRFAQEGTFEFCKQTYQLREHFLQSCNLPIDFDLSALHKNAEPTKDEMLFTFASNYCHFQAVYDDFVRSVCCPFVASLSDEPMNEVYYQSFPCVRVVRPGDFSIGPHADCAYGHHPTSINFYIPLTKIEDCASLFLESRPGSEDWHPIVGNYGMIKHFAGAICSHWTPENNTDFTRVSLDFRIIPGPMFHALKCGGLQNDGYYSRCVSTSNDPDLIWDREGPLQTPDARFGFPWTKFKFTNK